MSDYIKREDALEIVNNNLSRFMIALRIGDCPSADVAPVRHGIWLEHYKSDAPPTLKERWICSWCGDVQTYGETAYCPNCGARMDGDGNETD